VSGFNPDLTSVVHERTVNRCNHVRIAAKRVAMEELQALRNLEIVADSYPPRSYPQTSPAQSTRLNPNARAGQLHSTVAAWIAWIGVIPYFTCIQ